MMGADRHADLTVSAGQARLVRRTMDGIVPEAERFFPGNLAYGHRAIQKLREAERSGGFVVGLAPFAWLASPILRSRLAREWATEPPPEIDAEEVIDHALRHLAWLSADDRAIAEALRQDWRRILESYRPAPFFCTDDFGVLAESVASD